MRCAASSDGSFEIQLDKMLFDLPSLGVHALEEDERVAAVIAMNAFLHDGCCHRREGIWCLTQLFADLVMRIEEQCTVSKPR
jgi:hypothetical protein